MDPLAVDIVVNGNRYTITKFLGAGGYGMTFKALTDTGNEVAVKFNFPYEKTGRKFGEEDRLSHYLKEAVEREFGGENNCITSILCYFSSDLIEPNDPQYQKMLNLLFIGASYADVNEQKYISERIDKTGVYPIGIFVTRFIKGRDIEADLLEDKTLSLEEAEKLAIQMLDALALLHKNNIYHRDIKPGNIMYDKSTEKFTLIDFGLSCYVDANIADTCTNSSPSGTLIYMTNKLIEARRNRTSVSLEDMRQADIFALGLTIYNALLGLEARNAPFALTESGYKSMQTYIPLNEHYAIGYLVNIMIASPVLPTEEIRRVAYEQFNLSGEYAPV